MLKNSEVTEENYYYFLGCVPPRAMVRNAFLVGEAYDHKGKDGAPRYELYFTDSDKYYYGGLTTLQEFMMWTHEDRPEDGKVYALTGEKSIASGNTWKDSEVKKEYPCLLCEKVTDKPSCDDCDAFVRSLTK
jgi:hypothetical protein